MRPVFVDEARDRSSLYSMLSDTDPSFLCALYDSLRGLVLALGATVERAASMSCHLQIAPWPMAGQPPDWEYVGRDQSSGLPPREGVRVGVVEGMMSFFEDRFLDFSPALGMIFQPHQKKHHVDCTRIACCHCLQPIPFLLQADTRVPRAVLPSHGTIAPPSYHPAFNHGFSRLLRTCLSVPWINKRIMSLSMTLHALNSNIMSQYEEQL